MLIRQPARRADDGYRSDLVPGLKLGSDAQRLADALALAAGRLHVLAADPPGLYAEVAAHPDVEEAAWLAFLIAYLCPLEDGDPFASIRVVRTAWRSGELPDFTSAVPGPRSPHVPGPGTETVEGYRRWAARSGSQAAAYGGDERWTPGRRFERVFERLAVPALPRAPRFDLLLTLGVLGRFPLQPAALALGAADETTTAAKRAFGIGEPLLLERRAAALARACAVPLGALDLALCNWERGDAAAVTLGVGPGAADETVRARCTELLGL